MSGRNRHAGSELRAKYARVFHVPLESVELVELEDERCAVRAPGLPVWTTDGPSPWPAKLVRANVGGAAGKESAA